MNPLATSSRQSAQGRCQGRALSLFAPSHSPTLARREGTCPRGPVNPSPIKLESFNMLVRQNGVTHLGDWGLLLALAIYWTCPNRRIPHRVPHAPPTTHHPPPCCKCCCCPAALLPIHPLCGCHPRPSHPPVTGLIGSPLFMDALSFCRDLPVCSPHFPLLATHFLPASELSNSRQGLASLASLALPPAAHPPSTVAH